MLTVERLKEVLRYEPETGKWFWLVTLSNRAPAGSEAGTLAGGYRQIKIDGVFYRACRLAWFYMTGAFPPHQVDHEDTDPGNDKWANLRVATVAQNLANRGPQSNNTSGYKGVSWSAGRKAWLAQITVGGQHHYLGVHATPEQAFAVYKAAAENLLGEYARMVAVPGIKRAIDLRHPSSRAA